MSATSWITLFETLYFNDKFKNYKFTFKQITYMY